MNKQYLCNAIPSPPDVRDYAVHVRRPVALPKSFKQPTGPGYDQQAGNCVMQAARNIMRSIYGIEFGVDMGYGGFRTHDGAGLYPNVAANGLCKHGIAPLKNDPGEREVRAVIDYYAEHKAKLHKAAEPYAGHLTWGRAYTAADIKQALYNGLYVAACFAISQWNPDSRGIFPCKYPDYGHHEMRIYGWEVVDGTEYACVQNSWGKNWGKKSACYVSWEDVLRVGDIIVFTPPEGQDEGKQDTIIRRTLRKGHKGEDVTELQTALMKQGCDLGKWGADGDFGSATYSAVKAFQKAKGLTVDGIAGPKTFGVLYG